MSEIDALQLKVNDYETLVDELREKIKELEGKLNDIYFICKEYR